MNWNQQTLETIDSLYRRWNRAYGESMLGSREFLKWIDEEIRECELEYSNSVAEIKDKLKDEVWGRFIINIKDLENQCGEEINAYEDILSPLGMNSCCRCGLLADSETELIWIDYVDWDASNEKDRNILTGLAIERKKYKRQYTSLCDDCLIRLRQIGKEANRKKTKG